MIKKLRYILSQFSKDPNTLKELSLMRYSEKKKGMPYGHPNLKIR